LSLLLYQNTTEELVEKLAMSLLLYQGTTSVVP